MLIMLSCAKTMASTSKIKVPYTTIPRFIEQARELAVYLSQYTVEELEEILRVNPKIAVENYLRFQEFHSKDKEELAALLSYTGIVYKKLNPADFTVDDFEYAQSHLRLTSFLYGLLRPLDAIRNYRLEGDVRLPELGDKTLFDFWKEHLTQTLIEDTKQQGGTLFNLASDEMRGLFNWQKVKKELRIITPEFKTYKNGKLKTIVIYTKMARGEMTRYILKNRITDPEMIKAFTWEGFEFDEDRSTRDNPVFVSGGY